MKVQIRSLFLILLVPITLYVVISDKSFVEPVLPGHESTEQKHSTGGISGSNFSGVHARIFEPWGGGQLPCFDPGDRWKYDGSPTDSGILFTKDFKTGSSTAAGITLRISRNQARRQNQDFPICKARFRHARAIDFARQRDPGKSFMWTIIRNPTDRLVSCFFHMMVSRKNWLPTDENFKRYLGHEALQENEEDGRKSLPIREMKLNRYGASSHYAFMLLTKPADSHDPARTMNQIMHDYDFIGVSERMDESAVALSMLMHIPLADVLYLSAKNENFDGGGFQNKCVYIIPSRVSPGMKKYFESDEFQERIRWDKALHQASNKSLDLTIAALGRTEFKQKLSKFRQALQLAKDRCAEKTVFPCSFTGGERPMKQTDCIWKDSGCGFKCLDEVATELHLWGSLGPLSLPEQETF